MKVIETPSSFTSFHRPELAATTHHSSRPADQVRPQNIPAPWDFAHCTTTDRAGRLAAWILAISLIISGSFGAAAPARETSSAKPKVIVMTDGEIDDHSSMIRFLLYTCDFDVQAIIETNSMFQLNGHSDKSWYEDQLAAYEAVYPNLIKHHPGYPTADELRARSFVGDENPEHLKGMRETRWEQIPGGPVEFDPADWPDTPGSDAIVRILLQDDPAPIHLQAWGGGNTASRAFHKLKTEHPGDYERAVSKVVMYNIWYQDDAGNYIETHHPLVTMVHCAAFAGTWNYGSQPDTYGFVAHQVQRNHGPLGALYPQPYVSEGDSPAFFYSLPNGLRSDEDPTYGGWGGRFVKLDGLANVYDDAPDSGDKRASLRLWINDANRDFEARMDWCVAERYEDANHAPVVRFEGEADRAVAAGSTVTFDASASSDPDGDEISYRWWYYREASSRQTRLSLRRIPDTEPTFSFPVPEVESGTTLHVILEICDNGSPQLKSYQRFILTVE
jgi:hypothetical protein